MIPSDRLIKLVTEVSHKARDTSTHEEISLQDMHDLCVTAAAKTDPDLLDALSSVRGMVAITAVLSKLPHIVTPRDARRLNWRFIRPS